MSTLFVTVRAIHFAGAMLLLGEVLFAIGIVRPLSRRVLASTVTDDAVFRWSMRLAVWGLAVSLLSAAAWLVVEAADMSGAPIEGSIDFDVLGQVLAGTLFGRIWMLRFALGASLVALFSLIFVSRDLARTTRLAAVAAILAAAFVGTLAWAGHAGAGPGDEIVVHLPADIVHLLASAAWLGALPGLIHALGRAQRDPGPNAIVATAMLSRRFSVFGVFTVSGIVLTGVVNAWFLVGSLPALFGTDYGRILIVKLLLVAAMITLAGVNRQILIPRLAASDRIALRRLRRSAISETAAGLAIIALVGMLGITVPAAHQKTIWPFAYRLSLDAPRESVVTGIVLIGLGLAAIVALTIAYGGLRRRRTFRWISGFATFALAASCAIALLAVPAPPTTYLASATPYSTAAIAHGAVRYSRECGGCHGRAGRGAGASAAGLLIKPTNLIHELSRRPEGDFYWSIAHGIPGTPMPAFAPRSSDVEIWEVIQYLRAESDAEDIATMFGDVRSARAIEAPDFTFEAGSNAQESLRRSAASAAIVLVLYTLPQSSSRLRALAAERPDYANAKARVVAVPVEPGTLPVAEVAGGESILVRTTPDVALAYALFARRRAEASDPTPEHAEFLIDRQGFIRARWIGVPDTTGNQSRKILDQIEALKFQRPRKPGSSAHGH